MAFFVLLDPFATLKQAQTRKLRCPFSLHSQNLDQVLLPDFFNSVFFLIPHSRRNQLKHTHNTPQNQKKGNKKNSACKKASTRPEQIQHLCPLRRKRRKSNTSFLCPLKPGETGGNWGKPAALRRGPTNSGAPTPWSSRTTSCTAASKWRLWLRFDQGPGADLCPMFGVVFPVFFSKNRGGSIPIGLPGGLKSSTRDIHLCPLKGQLWW